MRALLGMALGAAGLLASHGVHADGNAERGETLYRDFACYSCHGYKAAGRVPLSSSTSGVLSRADVFQTYLRLRADENPINPKNTMPNYSRETLSDAQVADLYAYITSLPEDVPELEEIPLMQELIEDAKRRANVE